MARVRRVPLDRSKNRTVRRIGQAQDRRCSVRARMVPNAFWHHELNPLHPERVRFFNAKGTKGRDFTLPKPPGEWRIVCLGDSAVEGAGVHSDETLPRQLEAELKARAESRAVNHRITVINAGVGAHNSAFSLSYLAFRLIHFEPDVLVIKSSYSDYIPFCVSGMEYDYTHAFTSPLRPLPSALFRPKAWWRLIMRLLRSIPLIPRETSISPEVRAWARQARSQDEFLSCYEDRFFVYAENIRSMVLIGRGRGIGVVLVDLPTSPDPGHFHSERVFEARFKGLMKRFEVELLRIAGEEGVPFVRTGPFEPDDFWDHCHFTASGNRKAAMAVADTLVQQFDPRGTNGGQGRDGESPATGL